MRAIILIVLAALLLAIVAPGYAEKDPEPRCCPCPPEDAFILVPILPGVEIPVRIPRGLFDRPPLEQKENIAPEPHAGDPGVGFKPGQKREV